MPIEVRSSIKSIAHLERELELGLLTSAELKVQEEELTIKFGELMSEACSFTQ